MPYLVIEEIKWPSKLFVGIDYEVNVKDFREATEALKNNLTLTADETFAGHVMRKWRQTRGDAYHQNGDSDTGFRFRYFETRRNA